MKADSGWRHTTTTDGKTLFVNLNAVVAIEEVAESRWAKDGRARIHLGGAARKVLDDPSDILTGEDAIESIREYNGGLEPNTAELEPIP